MSGVLCFVLAPVAARCGHILPDHEAKPVGVVVPPPRLHLHMMALGVEAERALALHVKGEGLVGRRGVHSLRPKPLVQRADLEDEAVVQNRPRYTVLVGGDGNRAEAEVALEAIHHYSRSRYDCRRR